MNRIFRIKPIEFMKKSEYNPEYPEFPEYPCQTQIS
jgi:hypothetical protein